MTAQQFATQPKVKPEPERDRWGRPYVLTPGGRRTAYTRCTTYVGAVEDAFNITRWRERHVAMGVASSQVLRDTVASLDVSRDEDKKPLDELCERAKEAAGASDSARWGTYMHSVTEAADTGQDPGMVPVPDLVHPRPADAYVPDLAAYLEATKGFKHVQVEQFSVLDALAIGGTADRVVEVDGRRYIADLKTGSVQWGPLKIAAQLAVYARSTPYDVETDTRLEPHGASTQRGIVIHLPAGTATCTLHWVDLVEGWKAVQLAGRVRQARNAKMRDLFSPFLPVPSEPVQDGEQLFPDPTEQEPTALYALVQACTTGDAVRALWAKHRDVWTPALTDLAKAHIATLATQ